MFDLIALAYQADITRVASYIMVAEGTNRTYNHIGVSDAFHPLSHHANNKERIEKLVKVQRYHVERFAEFVDKLAKTPDGDGSLLDHSMLMYGSNMSNSDRHNNYPLPIILVGGARGALKGGQHVQLPEYTTLSNLHLTVLNKAGVEAKSIGDSTRCDRGRVARRPRRPRRGGVDRRALLRGFASGLVAAAVGRSPLRARGRLAERDDRRARAHAARGAAANILVLATDAGKVVVDGGAAAQAKAVQQTLDELPGGRVAALFDTHWHLDQVGANEALGARRRDDLRACEDAPAADRRLLPAGGGSLRAAARARRPADQGVPYGSHGHRRQGQDRLRLSARGAHGRGHLCVLPRRQRRRGRRRASRRSAIRSSTGSAAAGSAAGWIR